MNADAAIELKIEDFFEAVFPMAIKVNITADLITEAAPPVNIANNQREDKMNISCKIFDFFIAGILQKIHPSKM
jgi:hypothetical protein